MTAYLSADVVDLNGTRLLRQGTSPLYTPDSVAPAAVEPTEETAEPVGAAATGENADETSTEEPAAPTGLTERVRRAEAELAEAERLAEIAADRAEVPSTDAAGERAKTNKAAAKRRERNNPDRVALRDATARTWMNVVGLIAAAIALGWSTANVQATAALRVAEGSAGWWLAWGVEPLISAALLTVMGATAYLASRHVTVTDRWVTAAKWVPLGYTVTLNCWTSLPSAWIAHPFGEFLRGLVVHSVGPVVVVLVVHALPVLWAEFIRLDQTSAANVRTASDRDKQAPEVDTERGQALLAEMNPSGEVSGYQVRKWARARGYRVGAELSQWIAAQTKQEAPR